MELLGAIIATYGLLLAAPLIVVLIVGAITLAGAPIVLPLILVREAYMAITYKARKAAHDAAWAAYYANK